MTKARRPRERATFRGPCSACGKVVPLTTSWRPWGHKPRGGGAGWCSGGEYVAPALRERIPEQGRLV